MSPALASLYRIFAHVRPELFFGYTIKPVIYALPIATLLRVKRRVVMISGLGYAFTEGHGLGRVALRGHITRAYRWALSCADTVIFQNQDDIDLFRGAGILNARTHAAKVNGSGVDLQCFSKVEFPPGPPRFLFVGRLLRDKGIYDFLAAAEIVKRKLPQARFVVVGAMDGNPSSIRRDELDGWISRGIIEYRGHVDDPHQEYQACHVFVLPSYREGTPRTCLEAMATGRAVITTDVPGCRETVKHAVTGLLVPPRDPVRLADAMLSLGEDMILTREMGDRSRRFCELRFDLKLVLKDTVDLILGVT